MLLVSIIFKELILIGSRKKIFTYLNDGKLPIDNNLAEQNIQKLTIQCDKSLHYGSNTGAKMVVTYHRVIGTVKLHSTSSDFFQKHL